METLELLQSQRFHLQLGLNCLVCLARRLEVSLHLGSIRYNLVESCLLVANLLGHLAESGGLLPRVLLQGGCLLLVFVDLRQQLCIVLARLVELALGFHQLASQLGSLEFVLHHELVEARLLCGAHGRQGRLAHVEDARDVQLALVE